MASKSVYVIPNKRLLVSYFHALPTPLAGHYLSIFPRPVRSAEKRASLLLPR